MTTGAPRAPRLLIASSVPDTLRAFMLPFAEHYRARGWTVGAATAGGTACPECVRAFDALHDIPWTRSPRDPQNLTVAPRRLREVVQEHDYDLVHVHDPIAGFVTRFALRRLRGRPDGVHVVYTAHGFHFFRGNALHRNAAFWTAEFVASHWTDAQVVINREDERAVRGGPFATRRRVTYMPGIGVDLTRYDPDGVADDDVRRVREELGLADSDRLLLVVAELNPGKRHRDALEALARLAHRDVVLAFAGVGPLLDALRSEADRLGIAGRVRWLGFRRDIPVLLRAADALLLPSEREGLPRCIMEASCLERPVVATRIRGVTELVDDGVTGLLHEVGDVAGLAAAVDRLLGDPDAARAMGRSGRRAMAPFDIENVLSMHDDLYAELLTSRARSRAAAA